MDHPSRPSFQLRGRPLTVTVTGGGTTEVEVRIPAGRNHTFAPGAFTRLLNRTAPIPCHGITAEPVMCNVIRARIIDGGNAALLTLMLDHPISFLQDST